MNDIFLLARLDYDGTYAQPIMRGTYRKAPPCPECKQRRWERIKPLVIEWEPGSSLLADFMWPSGLNEILVTEQVTSAFGRSGFRGYCVGPVEMLEGKPEARSRDKAERVSLPYEGPPLRDLFVTSWCNLDLERSKRVLVEECITCGQQQFQFERGAPLVINSDSWDGSELFRIREIGRVIFATTAVKEVIGKEQFTNVVAEPRGNMASY